MNIKNKIILPFNYMRYFYNYYISLYSKVSILLYHRVSPEYINNPYGNFVSLDKFEYQISFIKNKYNIISLHELHNIIINNNIPKDHKIVITFDDGYIDNYKYAFPILSKYSIPATIFLLSDYINSNETVWDWNLYKIIYQSNCIEKITELDFPVGIFSQNKKELLWNLVNYFKYIKPSTRKDCIKKISDKLLINDYNFNENRIMNWDEIKEMSKNLIDFGSHGCSHTSFLNQDNHFVDCELLKSKEIIENNLKKKCNFFSFPFGSKNDFSNDLINKVLKIYDISLLNIYGTNIIRSNNFFFQ